MTKFELPEKPKKTNTSEDFNNLRKTVDELDKFDYAWKTYANKADRKINAANKHIEELERVNQRLVAENKNLKEENEKLKAKSEQIDKISLNIGATSQELAKQIRDNILKDKESKTLQDDLKAINKDLKAVKHGRSFQRVNYWMIKLESLYPEVEFTNYYCDDNCFQIKAGNYDK